MLVAIALLFWALVGYAGWKVYSRAGFGGVLGLLFLIPIANFIALLYLAHSEWPIAEKNKTLK